MAADGPGAPTSVAARALAAAGAPPATAASVASDASDDISHLCEHAPAVAVRQLSFAYNQNYASGAALPLRMPSTLRPAGAGIGAGGGGAKRPSGAFLEAGTTVGQEAARVLQLAGPLLVEGVTNIATQLVATTCVARQGGGALALSALVLAQTQLNFGYSVICGIASAMETCCGQAYGAGQYHLLGMVLQCAQALCLAIAAPAAAAWATGAMGPLLAWLGQPPDVAAATGRLLQLTWPVLLLLSVSETTAQYLLSQGVAAPASTAGLVQLISAVPAYWLLIKWLGWLLGVAGAQVGLQLVAVLVLVVWRVARDRWVTAHRPAQATWAGWSLGALRGLPSYTRFAVPAAAMLCLEWWIWETLVFLTGLLPNDAEVQLAAVGFVMQLSILTWTLSYSVGTGAATRIANALGAGQALNARRIFRLACCMLLCVNACVALSLWANRRRLTALLTPDAAIAAQMQRILPAAIVGVMADGQVAVLAGLLRAAGRQATGAALYFTSYWLIGLPTGIALGFWACWGALGLWLGVATATALQAVAVHLWVALRLDWHKEVARSQSNLEALLDCHAAGVAADAAGAEDDGGRGTQGAAGAGAGDGDVTEPLLGRGA